MALTVKDQKPMTAESSDEVVPCLTPDSARYTCQLEAFTVLRSKGPLSLLQLLALRFFICERLHSLELFRGKECEDCHLGSRSHAGPKIILGPYPVHPPILQAVDLLVGHLRINDGNRPAQMPSLRIAGTFPCAI